MSEKSKEKSKKKCQEKSRIIVRNKKKGVLFIKHSIFVRFS